MKIKTSELTGAALDWAVAKCEGRNVTLMRNSDGSLFPRPVWADGIEQLNYSTFWAQGGPIIEREWISVGTSLVNEGTHHTLDNWYATKYIVGKLEPLYGYGPTPLTAAMRCYCCSKLGDIVEIPEEL